MNLCQINRYLVFAVLFAGLAYAVPATAYWIKGAAKCSEWVGSADDRSWILGFISGANYATNGTKGKNINNEDIYRFVTKYCKQNPADDIEDAMAAFLETQ